MTSVSAIVLAAGESRRMGPANKLLLPVGGVPVLRRTLETLLACGLEEIVVVLGHQRDRVIPVLQGLPLQTTDNAHYAEGQMTSVRAGLASLRQPCDGVMVCLADQPLLTVRDLRHLMRAFGRRGDRSILVPTYLGRRGNPIILAWRQRDWILQNEPNLGCRRLIERHPERVATLEMDTDHVVFDLDTPLDYQTLLARLGEERGAVATETGATAG